MKYYCNPININYRFQFQEDSRIGRVTVSREAADPSMICFGGRYYLFASMTLGVWVSDDLASWEFHPLPKEMPLYDYAPDIRVVGDWVYFCASRREEVCDRYRTRDILKGPYEKIPGTFPYWDPNLFQDEDGRVYFYWGCSNCMPIWGVELDPVTMNPKGEKQALISGAPLEIGYERVGEDNSLYPAGEEEIEAGLQAFLQKQGARRDQIPQDTLPLIRGMFSRMPYIEGAWMDKYQGRYYLQYAAPGTEYNTYVNGVYVSDHPLGPFTLAQNNPFSYKPGGFLPGAGHGSSMQDRNGNWWHTATMRISVNHPFERRVGLWPAGFDEDGELYCDQRYGDWPMELSEGKNHAWQKPAWMLLGAGKKASASSSMPGHGPELALQENVQTWWRAAGNGREEWLQADLGEIMKVHAVQINFAEDHIEIPVPGEMRGTEQKRYIEEKELSTCWKLLASKDGENWQVIEDKQDAKTDLSHDLVVREEGFEARFLRLQDLQVPYGQNPCISGFRIFGSREGAAPSAPVFHAERTGDLDMEVTVEPQEDTLGYNILFGQTPEKLYHSYMVFAPGKQRIGALIRGREYYVRADAFNESGITEGKCIKLL